MRRALDIVHDAVDVLQKGKAQCHLGCDTYMLGALIKALHQNKLVWPRPSAPFVGVSFTGITNSSEGAQAEWAHFAPVWSLNSPGRNGEHSRKRKSPKDQPGQALTPESSPETVATLEGHDCIAKIDLVERLKELEAGIEDLELESRHGYYLY